MASTHQGPKPDETDSKAVGRRPEPQDQPEARHEVTKADAGEATATYRPAEAHPAKPEEEDELILEREPDGRYRVVGRRPRKKE